VEEGREVYGSYGVPPERTFVTFNSPDTDRLLAARDQIQREGAPRKNLQRLIHVGRLIAWKRVDLLLRALAGLCVDYPDIEVAVVGSGPQEKEWRELAADLGVAARVSFLGGVYDPVELGRELMRSGIFVLAGMGGLALNDAMCFGLPVVCSVCDGTEKRLVEEGVNGLFFREGDAGDLEAKLRLLLESPDRCEEMGRRSLEKIRNEVNIHTVVERYVEAFEYVLGGAPAKRSILRGVK
jgi:glycosyltransferase involved in cell wall biosynthesis